MYTSNLENLNVDSEGDLVVIINDVSGICTLKKYSFADLRDIIKGTDLWDQNNDAKRLQENLKTIFGKIKGTLGAKYARDDPPPNTNLRQN
ncbi:erythrocyte membrane protein 1 (PfEMP1), exon 2, putative [Plasmodium reichenowi]|uniref:Erythrocyte membrane protein 1 (PfEMP1), exon 2, putative n=1 Tax=Plasmodium reichenowi TaxID=5854 RepID=A0A2P9D4T1_PLARE|nr:erythrocyte membrane protein 1 (PfEMP1), exon 2, putative [Plasmodium reichenowi]